MGFKVCVHGQQSAIRDVLNCLELRDRSELKPVYTDYKCDRYYFVNIEYFMTVDGQTIPHRVFLDYMKNGYEDPYVDKYTNTWIFRK